MSAGGAPGRPSPGRWAALMYHELAVPGRGLAADDPGYAVYCVDRDAFRDHVDALLEAGLTGTSLGGARASAVATNVAITFDDGCATDWFEAAPILRDRGFGATFFVISGFLGRRGYLIGGQVRELAAAGFEIGSHSTTHRMLSTLDEQQLMVELASSRTTLEDVTGAAVKHFSCPHGRWSPAIAAAAIRAGYETVSTSAVGLNGPGTPATQLRRIAVQRGTHAAEVTRLASGRGLWRRVPRAVALHAAKRVVGESGYAVLRDRLLRRRGRDAP